MSPWRDVRPPSRRRPPAWWPHDEPWPPHGSRSSAARRRARFVRRSGWYSFWPLWGFLWILGFSLRGRPFGAGFQPGGGVVLILACAAAAGTVALIIRRIATPLADIASAADSVAHRDYRVRITEPAFAPGWVGDTARAFNAMAQELDAQDQARRHLMADVAHELRTPLAVMQGKLEGLIDGVYPLDNERLLGLLDDTRIFARIVEDLRTLSTAESGALALSKEPTDLLVLANDAVSSLLTRADEAGVRLGVETDSVADIEPIAIDPLRIREVLTNLVANALRYTPPGGRVDVKVGVQGDGVEVRVVDTGAGISAGELPRIFDRFYKGAGSSGSGLGLTIARNLVEAHGGTIRAESRAGAGTTIIFTLPR
jgi:two-component system sensor histidine kinase BaeS